MTDLIRKASPQAWRRLREAIGQGEVDDLAYDIAQIAHCDPDLIAKALEEIDWSARKQG